MVLSIAHMSMVIFPYIFNISHMSGVKKRKTKKMISLVLIELALIELALIEYALSP